MHDGLSSWGPFRHLALAQAAHAAGDAMVAVGLADTLFFSVPVGEARDKVALYLALTMAPFAVLSPLVGPWLDRRRGAYRLAIVLAAVGRAVLAVLLSSRTDRLTLYPLAFGLLVLSRVHGVSRSALVPDALPPGRLPMWGNAWLAIISVAGAALGAGVAAGATAISGPDLALWTGAAIFAGLALPAIRLPGGERSGVARPRVEDYRRFLSARLLGAGVAMSASRAGVGFLTFLMAFVLRGEGEGGEGFVVIITAAAFGGLAGSVLAPLLRGILRESMLLLTSLALMAGAALWAAETFELFAAAVVAGVVGFAAAVGRLAFDSLLQHDAPEAVRGRAFARYETIFQLCWVTAAGVATAVPFRARGGLRTLAAIAVVGIALSVRGLLRDRARS